MKNFLLITSDTTGVLARITSIVSAVGVNIAAVSAFPSGKEGTAVVHLRLYADAIESERIRRRLSKLVDVRAVYNGTEPVNAA
ncbi:MAG TPA: ACT domain-containing protein [Bryobacteraceae bacterium]|nr:ACT domain-containing protein [Bryobacteraceae bacterium]